MKIFDHSLNFLPDYSKSILLQKASFSHARTHINRHTSLLFLTENGTLHSKSYVIFEMFYRYM